MPYYKTTDFHEQLTLYQQTIAYIENVMLENRDCSFILLLDMNCNLYDRNHPYSKLLANMMDRFSLKSAFDLIPSFDHRHSYTRSDVKTNSFTLIDGILVSESLTDRISNVRISHCGENVSDHSPVELDIDLSLSGVTLKRTIP